MRWIWFRNLNLFGGFEPRWQDRIFRGHASFGPVVIYGANAMHWAIVIRTRWGTVCYHPSTRTYGSHWPWYFYVSPDATPQSASFGCGPGYREDRA